MKVIIVGSGPSSLITALLIAKKHEVLIIEKNNKVGKKILISGNGRCNFFNKDIDAKYYYSTNKDLLEDILKHKEEVLPLFKSLGLVYKEKNGYYYPITNQASSLLDCLLNKIKTLKIKINLNEEVLKISKKDNFEVKTSKGIYEADIVVLASGSYAALDKEEVNSYSLAKNLGHSITPIVPSLVQLKGQDKYYNLWEGIRCEALLSLYIDNKFQREEYGEIQLTNYGISGICVFNLSGDVALSIRNNQETLIKINFVPWFKKDKKEFINYLNNLEKTLNYNLKEILNGFLNYKLTNLILKLANIKEEKWSMVKQDKVLDLLFAFPFKVLGTNDFKNAQVSRGGIPLKEINTKTMESKIVKNLYLTGEILDVDGICGGYNLGFAWMSGIVASKDINQK